VSHEHFGPKDIINIAKEVKNCYKGPVRKAAAAGATLVGFAVGAFAAASSVLPQTAAEFLVVSAATIISLEGVYFLGAYVKSTAKVLYQKYTFK